MTDPTWFDNPVLQHQLWPETLVTIYMTLASTALTVLVGLPLGLALVATAPKGLVPNALVNRALSVIVNIGRSIPFIILMISIIPFTRLLTGSTLGWRAAVVPLTVAAIPFFARLVETALYSVTPGKIEAAQMMGADRLQILGGVMVREALSPLIQAVTVLMITLLSYTAMAGAIGAGGLGQLALNYGYNRFQGDVMLVTVVVIIVMVQAIQMIGDLLARLVDHTR